jgi:hypothetical protein
MEASLPHGDTSGEEAESCEGLIRTMVKGVRENVDEHDSDQEAESKLENFDGRDLKEWKRFILRNYSKTGKRAKKKKDLWNQRGLPEDPLALTRDGKDARPSLHNLWDIFCPGSNTEESCR